MSDGWEAADITDAIYNGPKGLESLDQFESIDHLDESTSVLETSMSRH